MEITAGPGHKVSSIAVDRDAFRIEPWNRSFYLASSALHCSKQYRSYSIILEDEDWIALPENLAVIHDIVGIVVEWCHFGEEDFGVIGCFDGPETAIQLSHAAVLQVRELAVRLRPVQVRDHVFAHPRLQPSIAFIWRS